MANISHFTQTVNGISTTYDIHDANAVPRSGGDVMTGNSLSRTVNNDEFRIDGGTSESNGSAILLRGKDKTGNGGETDIVANDGTDSTTVNIKPNGTITRVTNNVTKNIAMYEDVIPRSGGAVFRGFEFYRSVEDSVLVFGGGAANGHGATVELYGKDFNLYNGWLVLRPHDNINSHSMVLQPSGTWTWDGTACQIVSDQRLKQQIAEIDDKLLDAWEDVEPSQFKYNDAVDTKGKSARLHTGYVVQQIDSACKSHGVDVSQYGLYCHEEYPQETEEVEVEQKDGTKTKETKVIREASEHYSLRYTEVYAVECMYLRRCIARLTARIEELEKGNKEAEK